METMKEMLARHKKEMDEWLASNPTARPQKVSWGLKPLAEDMPKWTRKARAVYGEIRGLAKGQCEDCGDHAWGMTVESERKFMCVSCIDALINELEY